MQPPTAMGTTPKKRIYLAQQLLSWHDCGQEATVFAYYKKEDAQNKILRMINNFKTYCKIVGNDIVSEMHGDERSAIENSSEDRLDVWIDTAILH